MEISKESPKDRVHFVTNFKKYKHLPGHAWVDQLSLGLVVIIEQFVFTIEYHICKKKLSCYFSKVFGYYYTWINFTTPPKIVLQALHSLN